MAATISTDTAGGWQVGVVSDTHGLLRPEALRALEGVHRILHAGDVGNPAVLDGLRRIAPVTAVRGNNDRGAWAETLPETEVAEVGNQLVYLLHDLHLLDLDPRAAGFRVVVSGHAHKPLVEDRGGVLHLNPGSAGPRRFKLPVTVARLEIVAEAVRAQVIHLDI